MLDSDSKPDKVTPSNTKSKSNTSTTSTNDTEITTTITSDKSEKVSKGTRKTNKSVKRRSTADIPTQKKPDKKKQKKSNTVQQTNAKDSKPAEILTSASTLTGTPFISTPVSYLNDNIQTGALNIAQELAMNRNNTLNSLSPEIANIISSQNQMTDDLFHNTPDDKGFSPIPNSSLIANNNHSNNNNNTSTLTQANNNKPMKITSLISKTVYPRQKRLLNPGNGKLEMMNNHINVENDRNNKNTIVITPENSVLNSSGSDLYLKSMQLLNHKNNSKNNSTNTNYVTGNDRHTQSNISSVSSVENLVSQNEGTPLSSSILSTSTSSSNIVSNMQLPVLASSSSKTQRSKKQTVEKSVVTKNHQGSVPDSTPPSTSTVTTSTTSSSEATKSMSSQVTTSTTNMKISTKKTAVPRKKKTGTDLVSNVSSVANTANTAAVPIAPVRIGAHLNNIVESKVKNLPTLKPKPVNARNNNITTSPTTGITISNTYMPSVIPSFPITSKNPNNIDSGVTTPKNNSSSQANLKKSTSSTTSSMKAKTKLVTKSTNTPTSSTPHTALTISNMTSKNSSKSVTSNPTESAATLSKINNGSNSKSSMNTPAMEARTSAKSSNSTPGKPTDKKKVVSKVLVPSPDIDGPSLLKSTSILSEAKSQLDDKHSKKIPTKEETAVILNIPLYDTSTNDYLDENGTVVVNVIDLVSNKMIHKNSKDKLDVEQEKLNKRSLFINKSDRAKLGANGSGMDGISTDGEDINRDTKKKAHPMKGKSQIGKYDMEDPFIDDSELLWEEQRATTKDGFFVFFGPLIEKDSIPKIERTQSSFKRSRRQ